MIRIYKYDNYSNTIELNFFNFGWWLNRINCLLPRVLNNMKIDRNDNLVKNNDGFKLSKC